MTEVSNQPSTASNRPAGGSAVGVPAAIVVAGGLIALAIYFGGSGGGSATNNAVAVQTPAVATPAPIAIGDIRPVGAEDHVRGPENAKVTVIEYSDLECPFCKRFHPTMQQLVEEYPNDVRWVYRHFPLDQLHAQAREEALATECAGEQGKFWEFTDLIYETTPSNDGLDLDSLPDLAQQAGVANIAQFTSCVESKKYADKVDADIADAQAAGGRGTPYSIVLGPNGEKEPINGAQPYASVKALVEKYL